jgi:hypothetical protein
VDDLGTTLLCRGKGDELSKQWRLTNIEGGIQLTNVGRSEFSLALKTWGGVSGTKKDGSQPAGCCRLGLVPLHHKAGGVGVFAGGVFHLTISQEGEDATLQLIPRPSTPWTLLTPAPLGEHVLVFQAPWTFESSAYKQLLVEQRVTEPITPGGLRESAQNTCRVLAALSEKVMDVEAEVSELLKEIEKTKERLKKNKRSPLLEDPTPLADAPAGSAESSPLSPIEHAKFMVKLMWTSHIGHNFDGRPREFCWLLNRLIRENDVDKLRAAEPIIRALNLHCVGEQGVRHVTKKTSVAWPKDFKLYRGGGFNMAYKFFFEEGVSFRTPGFLATSPNEGTVLEFMSRPEHLPLEPIKWTFHIDPNELCWHVNFMDFSMVCDENGEQVENEFLFSPFSAFTVLKAKWQPEGQATLKDPHEVELYVFHCNKTAPETLPLSPWS